MMLRKIAALTALVLLSGGCAGAENSPAEAVMHDPGRPTVFTIDGNGFWQKNGEEFFPLMACLSWDLQEAKAAGFNLGVLGSDTEVTPETVASNLSTLEAAHKNGIFIMLHICNLFRDKEDYEGLKTLVTVLKDHPALASWYLADEPELTDTTAETLRKAKEIIHELDPNHPVSGCIYLKENFEEYKDCLDVFMPDPYPVPDRSLKMVTDYMDAANSILADNISLMPYIQGFGQPFISRGPTEQEIRNITLQMIASAPQGIAWWAYGTMHDSPEWPIYCEMVAKCNELAPILYRAEAETVQVGNVRFARITSRHGTILIAVNLEDTPASAVTPWEITGEEFPMGMGVTADGENLQFAPQGCIIYIDRNSH